MYLATVLDCCTKKAVGYAIGATARGTGSGVRGDRHGGPQVPVHDRGDDPPTPGRGTPVHLRPVCLPPGGPRNSPSGGKDRDALGGCPGGSRQAPPSRNERDYQMVHTARSKTVRDVASQVEPDTQVRHSPTPPRCTGHRTRMTRSTEQQDKQPETHPTAQALLATLPTPCRAQRRLSQ